MALFNITIEKVVVKDNSEELKLLREIKCLLEKNNGNEDEAIRQQIMDKLNKVLADIKTTV